VHLSRFQSVRPHGAKPNTLVACCPLCSDTKGHVEIDKPRAVWFCMKCQRGGKVLGIQGEVRSFDQRPSREFDPSIFKPMSKYHHGISYLQRRGFTDFLIEHQLRPHTGPELNRVYFPFYTSSLQMCYAAGRATNPKMPLRWWYPAVKPGKSNFLWGSHRLAHRGRIVLCESILDAAWSPDRLALGGTSISRDQMNLLIQITRDLHIREIVVMFDGDRPGREATIRMAAKLATALTISISTVECPEGEDPCDLGMGGEVYMLKNLRRFI